MAAAHGGSREAVNARLASAERKGPDEFFPNHSKGLRDLVRRQWRIARTDEKSRSVHTRELTWRPGKCVRAVSLH